MYIIIEALKAVLFGIVEGVTEWIPVSSTGHLILLGEVVKFSLPGTAEEQAAFMEFYDVVIQLGAILAVVIIFFKKIWPFGIYDKNREEVRKVGDLERHSWRIGNMFIIKKDIFFLWIKLAIACLPGLIYGVLLDDVMEEITAPYKSIIVAVMLLVVGILFIVIESIRGHERPSVRSVADINMTAVIIIGIAQVIAGALPGTSRSGDTIIAGLLLGLSRVTAAEFTFFLAIPTMFGASLLKLIKYLGEGMNFTPVEMMIVGVSSVTAFAVSMLSIRFLMGYVKKHNFKPFGWYRIVLGIAVLALFFFTGGNGIHT